MSDQIPQSTAAIRSEPLPSKAPWYKNRTLRIVLGWVGGLIAGLIIGLNIHAPANACQATFDQQSTLFSDYRSTTSSFASAVQQYLTDGDIDALNEELTDSAGTFEYLSAKINKIDPATCK